MFRDNPVSEQANALKDEVFVLTLPAFVWLKANYTPSDPRVHHTCHVVGNRQLLSVGGLNPSLPNLTVAWNHTDPYAEGLKGFDMTSLQWTNYYNASAAPYVPSDPVMAHYELKSRYPFQWDTTKLEKLFIPSTPNDSNNASTSNDTVTATTSNNTNIPATSSMTPGRSVSPYAHRFHAGAIAGVVVGGVIGVMMVTLGGWCLCHRKAKEERGAEAEPAPIIPQTYSKGEVGELEDSSPLPPYEVGTGLPHEVEDSRDTELRIELDASEKHELSAAPLS